MMEEGLFPEPKVARVLSANFIEARLHTDTTKPEGEQIRALQKRFAKTPALPTFVILDPKSETPVGRQKGGTSQERFLKFLAKAMNKP